MIVAHLLILEIEFLAAISITVSQYSSARLLISSEAHKNLTFYIFIPKALQISIKYYPTILILSKSPINCKNNHKIYKKFY